MNAQNEDVSTQDKDTTSTQTQAPNIEEFSIIVQDQDSIVQDQVVSSQDIIEIKESLSQLLTAQLIGYERVIIDAKKKNQRGFGCGMRTYLLISLVDNFNPVEIRLDFAYNITDRLFLSLIFDLSWGLFPKDQTFGYNMAAGGEIGYDILKTNKGNLDVRGAVATTMFGESNYKYTSYDAGIHWSNGLKSDMAKVTAGIGVKYYDSKSSTMGNNWCIFYAVGWKF